MKVLLAILRKSFLFPLTFMMGVTTGEEWSSKKGSVGFWKKLGMLTGLFFGIFLDFFIPLVLELGIEFKMPFQLPFGLIVGIYIILNECISICENLYQCNEKSIPKWIANLLKIASNQIDKMDKNQESEGE